MAPGSSSAGHKLAVNVECNHIVPLTLHKEKILLTITAPSTEKGKTASLDLVVVLDISGSMQGQKLEDMKQAAKFVIAKIGTFDTLTFVPFSDRAWTPSENPPLNMSKSAKNSATVFVEKLRAQGDTNIKDGLLKAVRILHGREDKTGRAAAIFLMSDGWQNVNDARDVEVHDFPVFTFGFGYEQDEKFLEYIANRNKLGGTYHNVPFLADTTGNSLLDCFAMVLGCIRNVSVLDLEVTLKPHAEATIMQVDPGNYRTINKNGNYIIHYGLLARNEKKKIILVIQLPAVKNNEKAKTVMGVDLSYRLAKERESTQSHHIDMARDRHVRLQAPSGHFKVELVRREHAQRIGKMKRLADAKDLDQAMDELAEAKNALRIMESTEHSSMDLIDSLSLELEHLEELLESHEVYNQNGRAYMLAALLSHDCQRFAARGGPEDVMIYALPRMLKYARHAEEFYRNPNAIHI